jgi:diguanylate cyclase (GGDEF)-like protein/PAS domain S-box-containing protein
MTGVTIDFETLFRAAPAGSVITTADHTILDVNDAFTDWTGHDRDDLLGTSFLRLLPVGDRILFATRSQPLLDLTGRIAETAVTILGRSRTALPAALVASRVGRDPELTVFLMGPRRERSTEESLLLSAVHRAEDSDSRRQEAERDLEHQAHHDPLTGLPNRRGLLDSLSESFAEQPVSVFWVGLDHFRVINESVGRTAGDEILTTIAQRLRRHAGSDALVARVGDDEFAVVARGVAPAQHAEALLALVAEPLRVDDLEIVVSASIGVASLDPTAARTAAGGSRSTAETLLRTANTGMHDAKAAGRARWKPATATTDDSAIDEIRLVGEIRAAIAGDQLRLEYQPQLDLRTGRLHGFEALLRWEHPDRGLIGPSAFIDVAEKTGLISQLGTWACRTAIARATELNEAVGAPLQMSVNISARQLGDPHFADTVASLLQATCLDPARLTLEITETSLIIDARQADANLASLHDLGVQLSIDDFGTGHAGFSYLSEFPLDEIKIDRSFVDKLDTSPEATAIVVSCIELAHALDIAVVAEGVETAAQLARLTALGCDIAQGYHYSRPLRAEALPAWIGSVAAVT